MPKQIFFFLIFFCMLRGENFHFLFALFCFLNFIHDFFICRFVIKDSIFALCKFHHLNSKSYTKRKSSALSECIAPLLDRIARFLYKIICNKINIIIHKPAKRITRPKIFSLPFLCSSY